MHVINSALRLSRGGVLDGARVVVTGGAGFIGSHVVLRLLAAGAQVRVIDDLSTGLVDNLDEALKNGLSDTDIRICDIRTQDCAEAISYWRPNAVVHLAAQASLPAAVRSPLIDADINIRGTVNLLDACVESGVQLIIYAASSAIYGEVTSAQLPLTESAPIAPITPYGLSKATALHYLQWYRRHRNLPYTAVVLGNVYGPRQAGRDCGVVARMAGEIMLGNQPLIFGDGHQTRDFVHVRDVADAMALACATGEVGTVNIGSGVETSVSDVFKKVSAATNSTRKPRFVEAPPGDARRMVLDISKAGAALGWRPTIRLTEGIQATVRETGRHSRAKAAS
ncbi:NAD-dependent epimerase/dehydratase family protein [Micromonosporaceae bacterium Da 78-11]